VKYLLKVLSLSLVKRVSGPIKRVSGTRKMCRIKDFKGEGGLDGITHVCFSVRGGEEVAIRILHFEYIVFKPVKLSRKPESLTHITKAGEIGVQSLKENPEENV
jgi:hypothetical protein